MGGLQEGCKEPYSQQVNYIIKLALIAQFGWNLRDKSFEPS